MAPLPIPADAQKRAHRFVGRTWVLDEVARWLDGDDRCLLIVGEPGSGKTALASWLAGAGPSPADRAAASKLSRIRGTWDAVHFCVGRGQRGTVNPEQFTRLLASQLAERHEQFATSAIASVAPDLNIHVEARENWGTMIGLKVEQFIFASSNAEDAYNRVIREPLQEMGRADPALRIVILVDALDEAVSAEPPNIVTLLAGSGDIPAARLVLTTRNEPKVIDEFDDVAVVDLSADEHTDDVEDDLRRYVTTRVAADAKLEQAGAGDAVAIEDRLVHSSAGNFLYATFVLDEFAEGNRNLSDLDALPSGLYGLYRIFLDRLVPRRTGSFAETWLGGYAPIFGILSVAAPAAPENLMSKWLGWSEPELRARLEDITQLVEYLSDVLEGRGGYRLYHQSIADFLASRRYRDNGSWRPNRYYVEPARQHERIASYYLKALAEEWAGEWRMCDAYGLQQLVGHLKAAADLDRDGARARRENLYAVALDEGFQTVQRERLGIQAPLTDLRSTLEVTVHQPGLDELLPMLRAVAAFRRITRAAGISQAILEAVKAGDLPHALELAAEYGKGPTGRGVWMQLLWLYLAWEAAQAGGFEDAQHAVGEAGSPGYSALGDLAQALVTGAARALAANDGEIAARLESLGWALRGDWIIATYAPAPVLEPEDLRRAIGEVTPQIEQLERLSAQRAAEFASARMFVDEEETPLMDPESASDIAWNLQEGLRRVAAHDEGRRLIVRALRPMLNNPYPRYRDIGLAALGTALLAASDPAWVRPHLQAVLRAGLDEEGVAFSFDLPTVFLAECEARGRSVPELAAYVETALAHTDPWGTRMRAWSARASVRFSRGDVAGAFESLATASTYSAQYAGYEVMALLSLVDRCHEFGAGERARDAAWGPSQDATLLDMAVDAAERVYDPEFREERRALVNEYLRWAAEPTPGLETAQKALSEMSDPDMRRAYAGHVSARWTATGTSGSARVRALISFVLFDTTTLDAILARVLGQVVSDLSDEQLSAAVPLVSTEFTTGRPWLFGQWR